jgi:AraC family transcriptional regulator
MGITPSGFRKKPEWAPWVERFQIPNRKRNTNMQVKIVNFNQTKVAVLEHRGDPKLVNNSVSTFIEWRKESGLSPVASSKSLGIVYDNPETTAPQDFRFDICGSVIEAVPENPQNIINKQIPAGRCAVVQHKGSHERIGEAAYYLYRNWLPESGEELRDFPLFFHYLNLGADIPEQDLLTDVYLPLK